MKINNSVVSRALVLFLSMEKLRRLSDNRMTLSNGSPLI
jgi:hypothetical protein